MRYFVYGLKGDRLYTTYSEGSMTGPLLNMLRAGGWRVFWRPAK